MGDGTRRDFARSSAGSALRPKRGGPIRPTRAARPQIVLTLQHPVPLVVAKSLAGCVLLVKIPRTAWDFQASTQKEEGRLASGFARVSPRTATRASRPPQIFGLNHLPLCSGDAATYLRGRSAGASPWVGGVVGPEEPRLCQSARGWLLVQCTAYAFRSGNP